MDHPVGAQVDQLGPAITINVGEPYPPRVASPTEPHIVLAGPRPTDQPKSVAVGTDHAVGSHMDQLQPADTIEIGEPHPRRVYVLPAEADVVLDRPRPTVQPT